MPTVGSKVLNDLTKVEKEISGLVSQLQSQSSQRTAKRLVTDAKNVVGKAIQTLPSSDSSFTPVRKSLTTVLNVIGGLQDGLAEGISRTDFKNAVGKLKTRFIPKFRESLDALVKKVNEKNSRLSSQGLLQSDDAIIDELRKVSTDVKRLSRTLNANKDREVDSNQIGIQIRNRIDLTSATYGSMPAGKDLDKAAETLLVITDQLNTISSYIERYGKVKDSHIKDLDLHLRQLELDTAAIHKLMVNSLLRYEDDKRPAIGKLLNKKSKPEPKEDAPTARSPDDFLKETISDIKASKSKLPKTIKGPYGLTRSPIVAIFDAHDGGKRDRPIGGGTVTHNFNKNALLDQYGVKYVMLEDYVILQDQLVLMVDRKAVAAALKEQRGKKRGNPSVKDVNAANLAYASGVVQLLNERGSQNYSLVSQESTANPRNANLLMFWVMPSRILDALIRRGWNKLSNWSLPFDV